MNHHTAQYIAHLHKDKNFWEDLMSSASFWMEYHTHGDRYDYDLVLRDFEESHCWLEDTPFDEEFFSKVQLDWVIEYLLDHAAENGYMWKEWQALIDSHIYPKPYKFFEMARIAGQKIFAYRNKEICGSAVLGATGQARLTNLKTQLKTLILENELRNSNSETVLPEGISTRNLDERIKQV